MSVFTFSILAALAALAAAGLILSSQTYFSRQRRARFHTLELVPNILMTRFPLMFVGRSRSLFRLSGDFLELPIYLQEHGYQVEEIEILDDRHSGEALLKLLTSSATPVHMIVSDALAEVAYGLALDGHPKLATLTILGQRSTRREVFSRRHVDLRPSRLPVFERPELRPSLIADDFETEEIALEHMVSLAEYDLR